MLKPRILLDLDDTITDFLDELISRYNRKYSTNFTREHCYKWELNDIFENNILELIDEEDFFESVKPKVGAVEYIKKWIEEDNYDVFIVTSCLKPKNYVKKIDWFKNHMSFFPIGRVIPLTEKSAIWGDVLVDDRPKNLYDWKRESRGFPKFCLLFNAPHNKDCDDFMRVNTFEDVDCVLESYFKR